MTPSVAAGQFPQIAWQEGEKMLWNPVHRQRLKNRPEERVRLRIIDYLLHGGWSKHRISTEEAIPATNQATKLRTDLICYTRQIVPFLLVECKAEQVALSAKTADQIARYNQNVQAPYLLMSNGVQDIWHQITDGKVSGIKTIPEPLPQPEVATGQPLDYWRKRGFAGEKTLPVLRKWLQKTLNVLWLQGEQHPRFLSFKQSPPGFDLSNYYYIVPGDGYKLALSFSSTPYGGSRLLAIVSASSENIGMLEINLDLLFDERAPNATVYSAEGRKNIDSSSLIDLNSDFLQIDNFSSAMQPWAEKLSR